ncbi:MAG: hypothetical protein ACK5W1_10325 [Flavobacteriales bacterium]
MRKSIPILTLFILTSIAALSQQRLSEFNRDPEKFISELTNLFDEQKKGTGKDLIEKQFAPIWIETPAYTQAQQEMIYETLNLMLKNKNKVFPDFDNFIRSLVAFPKARKTDADFLQWQQVVLKMLADKKFKKNVSDFLETSATLFSERSFFQSDAVKWVSSSPGFIFEFDSVPRVVFPALDLKCYSKGDSSVIYATSGAYYPTTQRFIGEKGKVTWQRAGFDPKLTYAEFSNYNIRVQGSTYVIDSVTFYNEFFERPLIGQLTEKILANKSEENATYPRFESYFKRLQIQNIVPNVDFDGGFTMAGTKLAGSGTNEEPALLTFYRDSKKFLVARSLSFDIKPDRIVSGHAAVTFYVEKDSITHPDLNFSFVKKTRQLVLLRTEEGVSKSPFQNTYHNIDMYFDALYWNLDDPLIRMGALTGSTQHFGAFESNEYFKKKRYDAMSGISMSHPLYEIKKYAETSKMKSFYATELAMATRSSAEQWHTVLIDLNNKGFILYDSNNGYITVRPKLYAYIENNIGKRDYDVIQFNSEVPAGYNAQLSLLNYDLLVKGIENFALSDSQKVTIYPQNGEVIIKKNRDFTFGGRVFAGNFEFMGSEYGFSYKDFRLDLIKVDSCRIYVEDESLGRDNMGNYQKRRIKSVLRDLAGNIKIDSPTNKGGYHSYAYPQYPIFTCTKTSYVYWEDSRIQKGAYKKDGFYYQVQPFAIDSLDNFTKKDLKFNGTLVSGIFPDIEEPLVLMEDYSLGFKRNTGAAGLPAYAGKSKITADLRLDFSGLKGSGDLDYLTAHASSNEFTFLPDSTLGRTTAFLNREQSGKTEIPKANCDITDLAFYPSQDQLDVSSIDTPIDFFEKEAILSGTLHLKPQGMTGEGAMEFNGAKLTSEGFAYTRRKILADKSAFQLAGMGDSEGLGIAFKTDDVNANVDFDKRQGVFKSNSGETKIEFPVNQYICFMDQFTWYMDKEELDLSSSRKASDDLVIDTGEESKRSNFFSIAAGQDSLNFLSPRAKYDLRKSRIACQKINYIIVADSKISPDSGNVVIEKFADMQKLQRARVLSNYVTQYYKLFNCELKIEGRKNYNGAGDIAYIDENKKEQIIHFNEIKVDTSLQTIGKGLIKQEDQFFLSPAFEYQGKFMMAANNPYLTFEGGTRILHNCASMERTYYNFRAEINPVEIFIPVDSTMRDLGMAKLGLGFMVSQTSPMDVYASFFSRKRDKDDQSLITGAGFLYFDKASRKYMVGTKEKIRQPQLPGNLITLGAETCELNGDGRVDFNVDYGLVKMTNVAEVKYVIDKNQLTTQGVTLISFPFDDGCLKRIYEQIEQFPNLTPVDITKTKYEKGLVELLGNEKSDKLISELNLAGQLKRVPEELLSTFYFADLKWAWDPVNEVFHTMGPVGIASMDKKQLFRYVKGKVEIEKRRSADVLRVYIELDPGNWYFFEYKLGIMNVVSSDKEFLAIMAEVKDDKRKFEEKNVKYTYQMVASKKKRDDFVNRYPDLQ